MSAVESLVCPHCGADLDVPDGVSILKCRFCGAKLQLKETGSVRALALIERGLAAIGDNTARAADGVERLHQHVANRRAEEHSRWRAKLVRLQANESLFRQRARVPHKWMVLSLFLWLPVTAGAGLGLSRVVSAESPAATPLGLGIAALFFGFPIAAILLSNRAHAIVEQADSAADELKAWKQREPL